MSDLSNQAQKLLGGFYKTVDVMKSAYSKNDKMMSVWADDLYAVEAVMSFLETIRDAPAQRTLTTADIRGAVARGWCYDANRNKEMDSDLAEAISMEIGYLLLGHAHSGQKTETYSDAYTEEGIDILKSENRRLRALVEGAITTFKAIYAKTPHPDIAEMAFNAIQTLSPQERGEV